MRNVDMVQVREINAKRVPVGAAAGPSTEWQILALDTLSRLTRQFAMQPDCSKLIDLLLLSVTGQLSTAGACALFLACPTNEQMAAFRGTGLLHKQDSFRILLEDSGSREYFIAHAMPRRVSDLLTDTSAPSMITDLLSGTEIKAVVPLLIGDSILGLLGLARKVDRSEFSDDDLSLLGTLAGTIAPLLSNSLLHAEVNSLNKWLRDVMDSVQQGVLVFDNEFGLKQANARAQGLFDSLGMTLNWSKAGTNHTTLFDEEIFPGWREFIESAALREDEQGTEKLVARDAEGDRIFLVRVSRTSGKTPGGSDVVVTFDDVTSQRDNERRMFEMEKFAEKGVMAASIAHELNNYLALILGGLELALVAIDRKDIEKTQLSMERLKKHSLAMERYTAGLLDYSRFNSEKTEVNLNAIVKDVVSFARVQRRFNGIHLGTGLDKSIPAVRVDADQIAQLLMNLLNNSADAINDADRQNGVIEVVTRRSERGISLQIKDNGAGIPDELKDKLFKTRFTTKDYGHGFGMVTCGRILEQHGALFKIESTLGEGTTITIEFSLSSPGPFSP